jgi:acyl-CoA thioesterase-2
MHPTLRDVLTLERLDLDLFRGINFDDIAAPGRIYGGQVIAQALMAAYGTIEGKVCHSMHGYFLREGDKEHAIIFEVDRARDGRGFASRRVIALQEGKQIFNLAASFQAPDEGFEHQAPMPKAPPPEGLKTLDDSKADMNAALPPERRVPILPFPAEYRVADDPAFCREGVVLPTEQKAWFRVTEDFEGDAALHQAALAFCSDMILLSSAMRPHSIGFTTPGFHSASLDHSIWFLHPSDIGQWHLHAMDSPAAAGTRGLAQGSIYRQDGTLVAICAQEGLMRLRPPKA